MKTKEVVNTAGFFAGVILGAGTARFLGFGQIVQFLVGIVLGIGFGWLAEVLYQSVKRR
ncbi:MAG: hypothetical protein HY774_04040 [Acidobacteria bacterium]|nr:hypothetical protein [Acidobacteriota bacterium]